MSLFEQFPILFGNFWLVFREVWWFVLPFLLLSFLLNLWLFYLKLRTLQQMSWSLLEIQVPREILRTPKAMEQIFASLAAIWPAINFYEKWWKGKVVEWASFEMVGVSSKVNFFIRIPTPYRNLIEAAIYAQYPGAEIKEIMDDYTSFLPEVLPNRTYDTFSTNFMLAREDAYPIRTYEYFEDIEEERRLDPLAAVTEVMSRLKEGEFIWIQILVQPTMEDWKKKADDVINELIGEKKPVIRNIADILFDSFTKIIGAPFTSSEAVPAKVEKKQETPKNLIQQLTPGKKDVLIAIEEKTAKIGFRTNIRFIYIDNRASFTRSNVSAIVGALQQFNTKNLNALKPDPKTFSAVKGLFKERRSFIRKRRLYYLYKLRAFSAKSFIMNTEELATIYHFPSSVIVAPRLERAEAKKGGPPANLPIG
ncbi:MAG: hypothetical protein Q8L47_04430 [bacterium]|nr:hypothetical protein [bacterium]